jgi:hypothetical protein
LNNTRWRKHVYPKHYLYLIIYIFNISNRIFWYYIVSGSFHHFEAIYQFPKHIICLVKIVANASLSISIIDIHVYNRPCQCHSLLRGWYSWGLIIHQKRYRPSDSNTNVDIILSDAYIIISMSNSLHITLGY